jgi:hypothetical protein
MRPASSLVPGLISVSASVLRSKYVSETDLVLDSPSQYASESVIENRLDRRAGWSFRVIRDGATFLTAAQVSDALTVVRFVEDGIVAGREQLEEGKGGREEEQRRRWRKECGHAITLSRRRPISKVVVRHCGILGFHSSADGSRSAPTTPVR